MTCFTIAPATGTEPVAYQHLATGNLLFIEQEGLIALQLRNLSTKAKTYTVKSMVQLQVQRGLLLPISEGEYLQHLQYLQDLHLPTHLQVM